MPPRAASTIFSQSHGGGSRRQSRHLRRNAAGCRPAAQFTSLHPGQVLEFDRCARHRGWSRRRPWIIPEREVLEDGAHDPPVLDECGDPLRSAAVRAEAERVLIAAGDLQSDFAVIVARRRL